jgi:type III protein arginine methyltransferase
MYGGLDKGGGGVVGSADSNLITVEFGEVCETTSAEEILICEEFSETGEPRKVFAEAKLNPSDGTLMWKKSYNDQAILSRTIGMSQMTSMLHDTDRNSVYERAIQTVISNFIEKYGRNPTVLDIGTGTGLLAMMCIRHGAEFVIGCEMFEAMADAARLVVEQNGLSEKILIVTAKSCDIDSLPFSPDLIISELLDSALLGEGVLPSHRDAIDRFLEQSLPSNDESGSEGDDVCDRVIPHSATIFGTLVQSPEVAHLWSVSDSLCFEGLSSARKTNWSEDEVHSSLCQWSRMLPAHWIERFESRGGAVKLTDPTPLLSAEFFHGTDPREGEGEEEGAAVETVRSQLTILRNGVVHGLLCWWTLELVSATLRSRVTDESLLRYSTAPGSQRWQDHWQQVVLPFPGEGIPCREGDVLVIATSRDALHVWCEVESVQRGDTLLLPPHWVEEQQTPTSPSTKKQRVEPTHTPPDCSCGWHLLCSSDRLSALNDSLAMARWRDGTRALIQQMTHHLSSSPGSTAVICDLSDGSALALLIASQLSSPLADPNWRIGVRVVSVERKQLSALFFSQIFQSNEHTTGDLVTVVSEEEWSDALDEINTAQGPFAALLNDSPEDSLDSAALASQPTLVALVSDCFSYQMHSQPVMAALSFLYTVRDLSLRNLLCTHPALLVVAPRRARIMTAAFQLHDLSVSHGAAGVVSGFDHSPLDEVQERWHDNWFPYKLGNYRKTLLSDPLCIATIDYQLIASHPHELCRAVQTVPDQTLLPVTRGAGQQVDCMALWVEYEEVPADSPATGPPSIGYHSSPGGEDFAPSLTTLTKFFAIPIPLAGPGEVSIACRCSFSDGDSELALAFDCPLVAGGEA